MKEPAPTPAFLQELFDAGHRDEPVLVQAFLERFPSFELALTGTHALPGTEYIGASADRLVISPWEGVMEVKSRQGDRLARVPTASNYLQIQTQLATYQTKRAIYVCGNASIEGDLIICDVAFDSALWSILEEQLRWFCGCVHLKKEPPAHKRADTQAMKERLTASYSKHVYMVYPKEGWVQEPSE